LLLRYDHDGVFLGSFTRPGEAANDVDLDIAPEQLTIGATSVPAGTLLFTNGETGVAEIYAINPVNGAVLATLSTAFGVGHVVGGCYHPDRNTFFLVQDKVPGGVNANRVAEINPVTGAMINTFQVSPTFSVNYGDIDIEPSNGNLLVVSSDETKIGEFNPRGAFVQFHPFPVGVPGMSGIGRSGCDEGWMSGINGIVYQLSGFANSGASTDINLDGVVDGADLGLLLGAWGDCANCCAADVNGDGVVDGADLGLLLGDWS
jgi:hypothetical protein